MVGEEGLEPSRLFRPADFKSTAYTDSATRPGGTYESRTRLKGFADLRVTAPPTRHLELVYRTSGGIYPYFTDNYTDHEETLAKLASVIYTNCWLCGFSSVVRALPCHGRGQELESPNPHQ